jgi:hypothetical protein
MNKLVIRKAEFQDERLVNELCHRNGLTGEISNEAWNWIWKDNSFYKDTWPIGWVIESNQIIVGYIGNIPRAYIFKGQTFIAGVARAFAVDIEYRRHSLKLISKFLQQKDADLLIFSSANNLSSTIYKAIKAKPIPQNDYNNDLFWVVSASKFIYSLLRKKILSNKLAFLIAKVISPIFLIESLMLNRWKKSFNYDFKISKLNTVIDEIDKFWHKVKILKSEKLLSFRDKKSILWQFDNESSKKKNPVIITAYKNKVLVGYLILSHIKSNNSGFNKMVINDLIVQGNMPDLILGLVKEAFLHAKKNNVDLLQITGFPDDIRNELKLFKPYRRKYSFSRFWYYVVNKNLEEPLKKKSIWYASIFDGDSSI